MGSTASELLKEALRLSPDDREALAASLLESLEGPAEELSPEQAAKLHESLAQADRGQLSPAEDVVPSLRR
jgi:hypothetical protein